MARRGARGGRFTAVARLTPPSPRMIVHRGQVHGACDRCCKQDGRRSLPIRPAGVGARRDRADRVGVPAVVRGGFHAARGRRRRRRASASRRRPRIARCATSTSSCWCSRGSRSSTRCAARAHRCARCPAAPAARWCCSGAVAAAFVLYRMLAPPAVGVESLELSLREGAWLALLGSLAIALGGMWPRCIGFAARSRRGGCPAPGPDLSRLTRRARRDAAGREPLAERYPERNPPKADQDSSDGGFPSRIATAICRERNDTDDAATWRRSPRLRGRHHRGSHQIPRLDRRLVGGAVLAPEGLHARVHDRARLHGESQARVRPRAT